MNSVEPNSEFSMLLEAIAFAARAHRNQIRKDGATPYVSHAVRVCLIVRNVFNVADANVLTAAVLHDTIEDTTTDFDDLSRLFGLEVAGWVAALTKDMRLPDEVRETAYEAAIRDSPWQVKICKLADIYDNLIDSRKLDVAHQARTRSRSVRYLRAIQNDPTPCVVNAVKTVQDLLES
jgi:guanosine-3',5'-bis(diphosphate) 3'-pyrophosphohydrolase